MAKMKIDELNTLQDGSKSFDYADFIEHYFDPMQISKKQKESRKKAANELMDIILYFLIWCDEFPDRVQEESVQQSFVKRLEDTVYKYVDPDSYFMKYFPLFVSQVVDTTLSHKGEEYFTSVERAANIAVNESNLMFNNKELQDAKAAGYQSKRWCTELDDRVRPTHSVLEGRTIPIDQPFVVGNSLMMFPKDIYTYDASPEESCNCRCSCKYL